MRQFPKQVLTSFTFSKSIKYALGEIILVVIGILIAFQLSKWADNDKAQRTEIATLKGLREALQLDKTDLEENLYWYNKTLTSCDTILALLENKLPYEKGMNKYFSAPCNAPVFFNNVGPYEALKSRGLETISNDSIRNKIVKIYEFNYNGLRIFESRLAAYVQTVENNLYPANFDRSYTLDANNWRPNDFSKLKQNKEYAYCIKSIRDKTAFFLQVTFIGTKKEVDELIGYLDSEIKRLE